MSREEFRAALARLGLTNAEAAKVFAVHPVSVRRFAAGMVSVPPSICNFVTFMLATDKRQRDAILSGMLWEVRKTA